MRARRFSVALPEDVMAAVDRAAASRGVTRSGLLASVLRAMARMQTEAEITAAVNAVMSDPDTAEEQLATARAVAAAGAPEGPDR